MPRIPLQESEIKLIADTANLLALKGYDDVAKQLVRIENEETDVLDNYEDFA
jgi:hypothetical protein